MAGHQLLNIGARTEFAPSLNNHLEGGSRPATSEPRLDPVDGAPLAPVLDVSPWLPADTPQGMGLARTVIATRHVGTRGRPPKPIINMVLAGPPPYEPAPWAPGAGVGVGSGIRGLGGRLHALLRVHACRVAPGRARAPHASAVRGPG